MIVLCDGCNTAWHQHCHDPPVAKDVVQVQEKEWFCSECRALKEEGLDLDGRVGRRDFTVDEVSLESMIIYIPNQYPCRSVHIWKPSATST